MQVNLDSERALEHSEKVPLGEMIVRITQERGPFIDITEESLESDQKTRGKIEFGDLADDANRDETAVKADSSSWDSPDAEDTTTSFEKARTQLLELVRTALNESALSLDVISLLVSGANPQSGASMSALLKQEVQPGTLSGDSVVRDPNRVRPDSMVAGPGWKLSALNSAADQLSKSAERLQEESQKEAKFWSGVIDTLDAGEVIVKSIKGDRGGSSRDFRIKYGYGDSGSTYSDPGYGRILTGPEGKLVFKPQSTVSRRAVRVSVYRSPDTSSPPDDECVLVSDSGSEIVNARNFLFEEELFFRLVEEGRELAGHRVRLINDKIVCQLYDEVIEIDQVPVAVARSASQPGTVGFDDDLAIGSSEDPALQSKNAAKAEAGSLAFYVCVSLHLILAHQFHQHFTKEHRIPEPLATVSHKEPASAPLQILGPVLAWRQHHVSVSRTLRLLEMMVPGSIIEQASPKPSETPLGLLLDIPVTSFKVTVPGRDVLLKLKVSTPLSNTTTVYEVESPNSSGSFYDLTELEVWVKWNAAEPPVK